MKRVLHFPLSALPENISTGRSLDLCWKPVGRYNYFACLFRKCSKNWCGPSGMRLRSLLDFGMPGRSDSRGRP